MTSVKYIGMDVHGKDFDCREELDRQNRDGVCHRDQGQHPCAVPRRAARRSARHLRRRTWAAWLYDLPKPHVTEVLVCNTRKNTSRNDSKSDRPDARKLSELLYMNNIKSVYHGEHGLRTLKAHFLS
jgi:hypothetical protein